MNAPAQAAQISWRSGLLRRLSILAVAVLLVGQASVAWFAMRSFEDQLEPQLSQKIQDMGRTVAAQIAYATDELAIPVVDLVGMESFFDEILTDNRDIEYFILYNPAMLTPFVRGLPQDSFAAVMDAISAQAKAERNTAEKSALHVGGFTNVGFTVGQNYRTVLYVGISDQYVRSRLSEIIYEVITVILVSWLVTMEFLTYFINIRISAPMERLESALAHGARGGFSYHLASKTRDEVGQLVKSFNALLRALRQRFEEFKFESQELEGAQIEDGIAAKIRKVGAGIERKFKFSGGDRANMQTAMQIRVPLFLFIFAEELSRSFLPIFITQLSPAADNSMLTGMPITLFMFAAAMITLLGAGLADKFGARRVFLAGIIAAVAGYLGTFLVQGYYDLIAWRILTGAGYGLTFIAAQAWVTECANEENRASGMAVFVGAVFAGAICGPSIGGIIANRIGFTATFLVSAALALVSAYVSYKVLQDRSAEKKTKSIVIGRNEWQVLLCDIRFLAVTVCSAVTGKLILAGFLFYLAPLYLSELGNNQSSIGRIIMLYGIATVACTTLVARFADRTKKYALLVGLGGVTAAVGCLALAFNVSTTMVSVAVLALGLSHGMALTPQLAIVQQVADRHRHIIGRASVVGVYRLIERSGLILGPLVAGALVAGFDYVGAIIGLGIIGFAAMLMYFGLSYVAEQTDGAKQI